MRHLFILLLFAFPGLRAQTWLPVSCGFQSAVVYGMSNFSDDTVLYIYGSFNTSACDTQLLMGLAQYHHNKFYPMSSYQHQMVHGMAKFQDTLFAGGSFWLPNNLNWYSGFAFWDDSIWCNYPHWVNYLNEFLPEQNGMIVCGSSGISDSIHPFGIYKYTDTHLLPLVWSNTTPDFPIYHAITRYMGNIYVGGNFQHYDLSVYNLAMVDTLNHTLNPLPIGFQNPSNGTFSLVEFQGKLFIGGAFIEPPFAPAINGLYTWDGTNLDIPGGSQINGRILHMIPTDDYLYVCGEFQSIGGIAASNLARWNGQVWEALSNDIFDNLINTMTVYQDTLFIAGLFSEINGQPMGKIAKCSIPFSVLNSNATSKKINLTLSPNPCTTTLNISSVETPFQYQFYNLHGQEITTGTSTAKQLDVTALKPGMYFLKVKDRNGTRTGKVVKVE